MENNWSPPSFKWTVSCISLNVIARWIRGSASLWSPFAQWHFSQVFWNVPITPGLCPSGVHSAGWEKWGKAGDGNEARQKELRWKCYREASHPARWVSSSYTGNDPVSGIQPWQWRTVFPCLLLLYPNLGGRVIFETLLFVFKRFWKCGGNSGFWFSFRRWSFSFHFWEISGSSSEIFWFFPPMSEQKGLLFWALLALSQGMQ